MAHLASTPEPEGAPDLGADTGQEHPALPDPHESFSANADTANNVVHARGELDLFSAELLRGAIGVLAESGASTVVVDLHDLISIDQTGAATLVELRDAFLAKSIEFEIINAKPAVSARINEAR